jgi:hypothetical protein
LQVELCPVAFFAAGRQALGATTVRQAFDRTVDPSETQGLFHHIHIRDAVVTFLLATVDRHPTLLGGQMVFRKPLPKLYTCIIF